MKKKQTQPLAPPPHSYIKHSPLPLYYCYTTSTHARTNTFDFTIIIGNDAYFCRLSVQQQQQNNGENRIRWTDRFYDIFMISLFYLLYFELFISIFRDVHVRIGFVPCEFPFQIYGLSHTNKVKHAVCVMLLCWCVHTYRQLFCHCVWWLPCHSVSSKPHII